MDMPISPHRSALFICCGPGINSPGRNSFYMGLFWPIKSASTRGGFELPAVPLESNPQTFSSMALILEKSQTCCLLSAEQISYYSTQSPPGPLACFDPALLKPLLQQRQGKIQASHPRAAKANEEEAMYLEALEPKTSTHSLQGASKQGPGLWPPPSGPGARNQLHVAGIQPQERIQLR